MIVRHPWRHQSLAGFLYLLLCRGSFDGFVAAVGTERQLLRKDAGPPLHVGGPVPDDVVSVRLTLSNSTSSELRGNITAARAAASEEDSCQIHPGKRLVVVTVDSDFADFFENWLLYAEKQLTPSRHKIVVIPEDSGVLSRLQRLRTESPDRFDVHHDVGVLGRDLVQVENDANTTPWGTNGFSHLVNMRPRRLAHFLQKGCAVLYVDVDTVWLKNPFVDIDNAGTHDIYLTDDHGNVNSFNSHTCKNGDFWNFCTCFMYVRPTDTAIQLMHLWADHAAAASKQDARTLNQPEFNRVLCASNATYTMMSRQKYPSGEVFNLRSLDLHGPSAPVIVHANYRVGHDAKKLFMQSKGLWLLTEGNKSQ
eukprot:TRINITY_DN114870_c0_g1_i1.p1 TRINITY_DN114870_c0_g1~~TRINITY_DN114870_c0_g1_i1.p1  ORF type:complete len:365 (+),score=66.63 TRINITY_DN114870_c0_g1_i1:93-1187(+)